MNPQLLYYYGQMLAKTAEIEGMKAANYERQQNGYALAYDESSFDRVCRDLNELAHHALQVPA